MKELYKHRTRVKMTAEIESIYKATFSDVRVLKNFAFKNDDGFLVVGTERTDELVKLEVFNLNGRNIGNVKVFTHFGQL